MNEIRAKFSYLLYPKDVKEKGSFRIVQYESLSELTLPNGKTTKRFVAKGNLLPDIPGVTIILKGEWKPWKDKKTKEIKGYSFVVEEFEEEEPTEEKAILKYLTVFDGIGKATAQKLYDAFGKDVFDVITNDHEKIAELKGFSIKKAEKIRTSYLKNSVGKELFIHLYKYGISDTSASKIFDRYHEDAMEIIKKRPYELVDIDGVGFYTAEKIAQSSEYYKDELAFSDERVKAAILQVLNENEIGGRLFSTRDDFPNFMKYSFLTPKQYSLITENREVFGVTGNTYLPLDMLYLQTLKLLNLPGVRLEFKLDYKRFVDILSSMYYNGKVFNGNIVQPDGSSVIDVYKRSTAMDEYYIAKKIGQLLGKKSKKIDNLMERITNSENKQKMLLSEEQRKAVFNSLTEPISIITGGPGTGKTAVQKILLDTYEAIYGEDKEIALAAPTGMASKKMSESTGKHARTIHSLLGLKLGESDYYGHDSQDLTADLLIVDEASMIDNSLMSNLLYKITEKTQLVIIGDVDQLPSVGCGCVLKGLIDSNTIPTVRLTNIFRQASGSSIAINAARIKNGETRLDYAEDFVFIQKPNTEEILKETLKLYEKKVKEKGVENVTVLSAYRRKTATGVNELNPVLRSISNKVDENTPSYDNNGITYYLGDKVMFTKNAGELINGDVGYIREIKNENGLEVKIDFSGNVVTLEEDDLDSVVLAYATTVHKSQGSEYDTVILIIDPAHSILLKRNLIYTGLTRAKKMFYAIGDADSFNNGIISEDTQLRRSNLSLLVQNSVNKVSKSLNYDDRAKAKKVLEETFDERRQVTFF